MVTSAASLLILGLGALGLGQAAVGESEAAVENFEDASSCDDAVQLMQVDLRTRGRATPRQHPWPHAFGLGQSASSTEHVLPGNLSEALAWSWSHPRGKYFATLSGGPAIDGIGHVYMSAFDGVFKLSQEGEVVWFHECPRPQDMLPGVVSMPVLLGNAVFVSRIDGAVEALASDTGDLLWEAKIARQSARDYIAPAAQDGVLVVASEAYSNPEDVLWAFKLSNKRVLGLSASTGKVLWEFVPEKPVQNFAALLPGDNSTVFMDWAGNVYKLHLQSGELLWGTSASEGSENSFSRGGAVIGPLDDRTGARMVFACSNAGAAQNSQQLGMGRFDVPSEHGGVLRAMDLDTGAVSWERHLPLGCSVPPTMGFLGGKGLSVVAAPGSPTSTGGFVGVIMVFDASTGEPQWQFRAPDWQGGGFGRNDFKGAFCDRAVQWTAPLITAKGAVSVLRLDGQVYTLRHKSTERQSSDAPASPPKAAATEMDLDLETTPGVEAQTWDAERAGLHTAFALAPGAVALATCDTLFFFKL